MDISTLTQLISSMGFPIAVCVMCFWYINKIQEQHKEEIGNLTNAVNNNTIVMERLLEKISGK